MLKSNVRIEERNRYLRKQPEILVGSLLIKISYRLEKIGYNLHYRASDRFAKMSNQQNVWPKRKKA